MSVTGEGQLSVRYAITNNTKGVLTLEPFNLRVTQNGQPMSFRLTRSSNVPALPVGATISGAIGLTRRGSGVIALEWTITSPEGSSYALKTRIP